jgi:hypothetical protein
VDNEWETKGAGSLAANDPETCYYAGPYRRLLADGAVVRRKRRWVDAGGGPLYFREAWFTDAEPNLLK